MIPHDEVLLSLAGALAALRDAMEQSFAVDLIPPKTSTAYLTLGTEVCKHNYRIAISLVLEPESHETPAIVKPAEGVN